MPKKVEIVEDGINHQPVLPTEPRALAAYHAIRRGLWHWSWIYKQKGYCFLCGDTTFPGSAFIVLHEEKHWVFHPHCFRTEIKEEPAEPPASKRQRREMKQASFIPVVRVGATSYRKNRYAGYCNFCRKTVQPNAGLIEREGGKWIPYHAACLKKCREETSDHIEDKYRPKPKKEFVIEGVLGHGEPV